MIRKRMQGAVEPPDPTSRWVQRASISVATLLVASAMPVMFQPATAQPGGAGQGAGQSSQVDLIEVSDLRVNGRQDEPLGVTAQDLQFSWISNADRQSAYDIRVATTQARLSDPDVWSSGRIESSKATAIAYEGPALASDTAYFWQVRIWDGERRESGWSAPSSWEMGLLSAADWAGAKWIDHAARTPSSPLPVFARPFEVESDVARARLYITGAGIVVPTINGKEITDIVLAPGQSNPLRSLEVGAYDVTEALRDGDNMVGVALGNGPSSVVRATNAGVGRTSPYGKYTSQEPISSALAADVASGATNVKVTTVTDVRVGSTLDVDTGDAGARVESRRIVQVGTAGVDGTGITLEAPLELAHAQGAALRVSGNRISPGREIHPARITPRFLARLVIDYADGTSDSVVSNAGWRSALGPYVTEHWYSGDDYDARREQPGWDAPGADLSGQATRRDGSATGWVDAGISTPPSLDTRLIGRAGQHVRVIDTWTPTVTQPAPGAWVFDMGQGFAGLPQVNVPPGALPAGTVIKMKPGEQLTTNGNGRVDSGSLGSGGGVFDTYTTWGDPEGETWASPFRYTGMQYIEVTGLPANYTPPADFITGLQTQADAPKSGDLETSSATVNRLHRMSQFSISSNMQSVFTDCPSREKLGWLADVSQSLGAIDRNFDVDAMLRHMSHAMEGSQVEEGSDLDGLVPATSPEWPVFPGRFRTDINWGSTVILSPYWMWKERGDLTVARDNYDSMIKYLRFVQRVQVGTGANANLVNGELEDWAAADTRTSGWITGTAGYYSMVTKLAEFAEALGHDADATEFNGLAADIKTAFNARFFDPAAGHYSNTGAGGTIFTQAAQAVALDAGLVPADEFDRVLARLVQLIRDYKPNGGGPHVNVGMVSLGQLVRVLQNHGEEDLLWELVNETTAPSWGAFMRSSAKHPNGLTTMPEFWDTRQSQNHMILLQVDEWFSSGLVGIRQAKDSIGYQKIVIDPQMVGTAAQPLTHAEGSYRTPQGTVSSSWERADADSAVTMEVTIPGGTTAEVHIPLTDGETVDSVRVDGALLADASGVLDVRRVGDEVIVTVNPGSYTFTTGAALEPGAVTGQVTGDGDAPVAGACVYLYESREAQSATHGSCADSDGAFYIGDVAVGDYALAVADPSGGYATTWLADRVTVEPGEPVDVDVTMVGEPTGHLVGTVTAQDTDGPLANVCALAYEVGDSAAASYATCSSSFGAYGLYGIDSGDYDLAFYDPVGAHRTQWWTGAPGGAAAQSGAVPVSVLPGGRTTTADAAMVRLSTGAASGVVTDAAGAPVAGVCAYLRTGPTGAAAHGTCTGADGSWWVGGVAPGTYRVVFNDPSARFTTQWWTGGAAGASAYSTAANVTVTGGGTASGLNARLAPRP